MSDFAQKLIGHDALIEQFVVSKRSGRLHHAWLLSGTQGVGKALFAWQAAAYLLSKADEMADMFGSTKPADTFHAATQSGPAGQMHAGSHPDFRYVGPDTTKASAQIAVEQIREMASMFMTTAGMSGWRVCIIDAAEDMNRNAANAILKLLEEPPARSIFFLISHVPGRLLPTVRSRCTSLAFAPLPADETSRIVREHRPDADDDDVECVAELAQGAPGRAIALLDANAADYSISIHRLFDGLPALDQKAVLGLADLAGDRASSGPFELVWDLIDAKMCDGIKRAVIHESAPDWPHALSLPSWLSLQQEMSERKGQALGLNLSPRHVILTLFADLETMLKQDAQY